jgi:hypothetical protein
MPIRSDPTFVTQPEEKMDFRDCSPFASVSYYLRISSMGQQMVLEV